MEYTRNTGDCFISNETLAKNFGVSVSTIKRTLDKLEDKEYIMRDTKTIQKGKERHMLANTARIDADIAKAIC